MPDIVRIRFEIHEALSLEQWGEQFIAPFQHLISLATQRPNAPVNIVGYVKPDKTEPLQEALGVPVQIASPLAIVPIAARKPSFPPTILFSLQDITPNFSDLIETWLNMADELNSSYKLFFGVQYTSLPLDLQFLLVAQATEIYQDKRFDAPPFPKDDYQNLLQQLLTACPNEEYKEWLKDTLEDRNNTTYRQQLRNLVKRTYTVLQPILGENTKKRNEFVEIAYNTRNYLTHHTPELALRSASGLSTSPFLAVTNRSEETHTSFIEIKPICIVPREIVPMVQCELSQVLEWSMTLHPTFALDNPLQRRVGFYPGTPATESTRQPGFGPELNLF